MMGLVAFIRGNFLSIYALIKEIPYENTQRRQKCIHSGRELLLGTESFDNLILDFLDFKMMRNTFLLFKPPSL